MRLKSRDKSGTAGLPFHFQLRCFSAAAVVHGLAASRAHPGLFYRFFLGGFFCGFFLFHSHAFTSSTAILLREYPPYFYIYYTEQRKSRVVKDFFLRTAYTVACSILERMRPIIVFNSLNPRAFFIIASCRCTYFSGFNALPGSLKNSFM